jgi:hypothetical protein
MKQKKVGWLSYGEHALAEKLSEGWTYLFISRKNTGLEERYAAGCLTDSGAELQFAFFGAQAVSGKREAGGQFEGFV